jgi:hypothetical protein
MMDSKSSVKQLFHLFIPRGTDITTVKVEFRMFAAFKERSHPFLFGHLQELLG